MSQVWTLGKLHAWHGSGGTQSGLLCSYDGEHEEWGTWGMRNREHMEHEVLPWGSWGMGKARQYFEGQLTWGVSPEELFQWSQSLQWWKPPRQGIHERSLCKSPLEHKGYPKTHFVPVELLHGTITPHLDWGSETFPGFAKFRRDRERLQCSVGGRPVRSQLSSGEDQGCGIPTTLFSSPLQIQWQDHHQLLLTGSFTQSCLHLGTWWWEYTLEGVHCTPWYLGPNCCTGQPNRSQTRSTNRPVQPLRNYSLYELYDACNRDRRKPDNLSWTRTCFHNYLLHPLYTSLRRLVFYFLWPSIWKSQMRPEANKSSNFELKASRRGLGCYESPGGSKWTCKGFMAWSTLANLCQYRVWS